MAGVNISEIKTVAVKDSDGLDIEPGDQIMIRNNRGEDVVCAFKGVSGGYFVTTTMDGENVNKYRIGSIQRCQVLYGITYRKEM